MFNSISSIAEFEEIREASKSKPQLLLKFSPICPTSFQVQHEMERFIKEGNAPTTYTIDVVKSRPISREIAEITGVKHESPQGILFVDGEVVWHGSHYSVRESSILAAL